MWDPVGGPPSWAPKVLNRFMEEASSAAVAIDVYLGLDLFAGAAARVSRRSEAAPSCCDSNLLIATTPGIKLLVPSRMSPEFDPYSAAVTTSAPQRTAAETFVGFLVSPKAKGAFAMNRVTEK